MAPCLEGFADSQADGGFLVFFSFFLFFLRGWRVRVHNLQFLKSTGDGDSGPLSAGVCLCVQGVWPLKRFLTVLKHLFKVLRGQSNYQEIKFAVEKSYFPTTTE